MESGLHPSVSKVFPSHRGCCKLLSVVICQFESYVQSCPTLDGSAINHTVLGVRQFVFLMNPRRITKFLQTLANQFVLECC